MFKILACLSYVVLIAIWIFMDSKNRGRSAIGWGIGCFLMPLLVPVYLVKTRPGRSYYKLIGLWVLGFIIFSSVGLKVDKLQFRQLDSFDSWCQYLIKTKIKNENLPLSIGANDEKIRDGFIKYLDDSFIKKAEGKVAKVVYREKKHLHIDVTEAARYFEIGYGQMATQYESGLKDYKGGKYGDDICLFGTLISFFDDVTFHFKENGRVRTITISWNK